MKVLLIRQVNTTNGSTTLLSGLAGTCGAVDDPADAGNVRFDQPMGIVILGAVLYVADHLNDCIRYAQ